MWTIYYKLYSIQYKYPVVAILYPSLVFVFILTIPIPSHPLSSLSFALSSEPLTIESLNPCSTASQSYSRQVAKSRQALDNIAIWSKTVKEHTHNVATILQVLLDHKLYLNPKKSKLFCLEIRFLGHQISASGVEADEGKAEQIQNWPTPTCVKHVCSFLGLVCYLSAFLPNLATHTTVLDELTTKECDKSFPPWSKRHQTAFENIKALIISKACLMTIVMTPSP